ncbi:MAG: DUF3857 domain-containing protein [Bacteroidota bacterium]
MELIPEELLKNAVAVIREDSREYTITGKSRMQIKHKRVVTILEAKGLHFADITLYYNSFSKISHLEGTMYDGNGNKIRDLHKKEFADRSYVEGYTVYNDTRVVETDLYSNQYPFTIAFEYTINQSVQMLDFIWRPVGNLEIAIEKASMSVNVPDDISFRYRGINMDQPEPEVTPGKRKRIRYSWTVENYPAIIRESWMPRARHIVPYVMIGPEEFVYGGYDGSLESWESFGKWINKLNSDRQSLDPSIIDKIREITSQIPDTLQKIRAVYQYVQANTRYVAISLGIGGMQPSAASEVLQRGYGDCKDLSNYTLALLQAIGIESYYTLIQSGSEFLPVQSDFPSNSFNHAILCVPLANDTLWLETTAQTIPAGYIGRSNMNRYVLLVTPQKGILTRTPPLVREQNTVVQSTKANLSSSGDIKVSMHKTFGETAIEERFFLLNAGEERQRDWFLENTGINQLSLEKVSYALNENKGFSLTEIADFKASNYSRKAGNRLILQPLFMHYTINPPLSSTPRVNDFQIFMGYMHADTINWQLPREYTITHLPDNIILDTPHGEYRLLYHYDEPTATLVVERSFVLKPGIYKAAEFVDFTDFLTTVYQTDRNNIMLQVKEGSVF